MASSPINGSSQSNPFQSLTTDDVVNQKPKEQLIKEAAPVLAGMMSRLSLSDGGYYLNDDHLRYIAEYGNFKNASGDQIQLSKNEQEAARKLLASGGIASIDHDQNGKIGEADFRRASEEGSSNETNPVKDFETWMNFK